ncbi:MAG TPA: hypothetical protein VGF23_25825 [Gaiellaceae bacterium]|jgi:hypothetical protein
MRSVAPTARSFGRGSRVLDYWLVHAQGFRIGSGRLRGAAVEDVVLADDGVRASALVVRRRLRGRRVIAADAIEAVTPSTRTLTPRVPRRRRPAAPKLSAARPSLPAVPRPSLPAVRMPSMAPVAVFARRVGAAIRENVPTLLAAAQASFERLAVWVRNAIAREFAAARRTQSPGSRR